jgi:hypothetical protein
MNATVKITLKIKALTDIQIKCIYLLDNCGRGGHAFHKDRHFLQERNN